MLFDDVERDVDAAQPLPEGWVWDRTIIGKEWRAMNGMFPVYGDPEGFLRGPEDDLVYEIVQARREAARK